MEGIPLTLFGIAHDLPPLILMLDLSVPNFAQELQDFVVSAHQRLLSLRQDDSIQ